MHGHPKINVLIMGWVKSSGDKKKEKEKEKNKKRRKTKGINRMNAPVTAYGKQVKLIHLKLLHELTLALTQLMIKRQLLIIG